MKNLQTAIEDIMANKFHFLAAFFCIFTLSYGILYALDFYPEPISADQITKVEATSTPVVNETKPTTTPVKETITTDPADTLPLSLTIATLDRTVKVLNPSSNSVAATPFVIFSFEEEQTAFRLSLMYHFGTDTHL